MLVEEEKSLFRTKIFSSWDDSFTSTPTSAPTSSYISGRKSEYACAATAGDNSLRRSLLFDETEPCSKKRDRARQGHNTASPYRREIAHALLVLVFVVSGFWST
ncbi:unnamed protein product [Amoebophrya sp. A25]|nr:unnamed protein product [Amoebophrya sp. A25]|eukprot:GSA25T00006048001.1